MRGIAIASLALLAGCSTVHGVYDPRRFADWPIDPAKKLDGCVTILTTPQEDAFVWRGKPTGFVSSAYTLEVPLGMITREAAVRVLGDLFRGGAVKVSGGGAPSACRVVVAPRPTRFAWTAYMFSRPAFELSVQVDATSAAGATVLSKLYESGRWRAGAPGEQDAPSVTASAHVVLQQVMLRAAADLKAELERARPPAGLP